MKIEDQLTSLELSKRLYELLVKQDSLFVWREYPNSMYFDKKIDSTKIVDTIWLLGIPAHLSPDFLGQCSAFTVAELGEMLPCYYKPKHALLMEKVEPLYFVSYRLNATFKDPITFHDKKEADARAKMLIYLIENGLITNDKQN
jgi:hypothetical protein